MSTGGGGVVSDSRWYTEGMACQIYGGDGMSDRFVRGIDGIWGIGGGGSLGYWLGIQGTSNNPYRTTTIYLAVKTALLSAGVHW